MSGLIYFTCHKPIAMSLHRSPAVTVLGVTACLLCCRLCFAQDRKQGRKLIDSLQAVLTNQMADTIRIRVLCALSDQLSSINPDSGINYARQALSLATHNGAELDQAKAYVELGSCHYYQSDYKAALAYWNAALALYRRMGDQQGILRVVGNIGSVHNNEGDYSAALSSFFEALRAAEALGDRNSIAINLGNLGSTYEYLKAPEKALEYDRQAINIFTSLSDRQAIAIYLGNMGNAFSDLKNYSAAIRCLDSARRVDSALGNNEGIARDMVNLGSAYEDRHDYVQALRWNLRTIDFARKTGFRPVEALALLDMGTILYNLAHDSSEHELINASVALAPDWKLPISKEAALASAIDYLQKSIAIHTDLNSLDDMRQGYATLAEAEAFAGNYKEAFESHKRYMLFKDSVQSTDSKLRIARLETQRELDLKDKQIIIDQLEVTKKRNERVLFAAGFVLLLVVVIIVVRNIRLSTAKELSENKLNAFQARMNPHFIFNSLSSIQSLIMSNEMEQSIDYLSEFSILMRQVLDNSALSKVTLKTEIDMLRSYIELEHLRFDGFSRNINIDNNIAEEKTDVPGMIIQPFVENAILHGLVSKGAEGRLDVAFTRTDKHIICTVEDNGVGRERSAEINKKRSKTRQSHGTAIATNRLTLLNDKKKGLINKVTYIDKTENGIATGTKVIIELPIL